LDIRCRVSGEEQGASWNKTHVQYMVSVIVLYVEYCNQWYKMKRHWLYPIITGAKVLYLIKLLVANLLR
jgi:hypothetical protein